VFVCAVTIMRNSMANYNMSTGERWQTVVTTWTGGQQTTPQEGLHCRQFFLTTICGSFHSDNWVISP